MKLGAQLYTVRDYTKTLDNFAQTLAKIAEIGYTTVQISNTCEYEPEWLAEQLKKNGLMCPATHTNPNRIVKDSKTVVKEHRVYDCSIIGIGIAPTFDYPVFRSQFLPAAQKIRDAGGLFGYHNHQHEFAKINGKTMLERIAEDFPSDALTFILDTYWIQFAGGNPVDWIRKFPGQVHCVHLKDMAIVKEEQQMAVIGEGNLNFDSIIKACEESGTQYLMVEQDNCYGENPFDCLKRSYKYLKAKGLK